MENLLKSVQTINGYLSDYILVILLIGVGLFYSIKTRFVQVRCFGEGMKSVFGKIKFRGGTDGAGLSSFQALATAIAAQVGTGNIVGASGAILVGGKSEKMTQNVTFNQTINSPEPVDRLSVYRDTNNLLFSAKVRLGNV